MARVEFAVRRDREVFRARAAAAETLDDAGPLLQIDHKVEEAERLIGTGAIEHDFCQPFIFRINPRQIRLGKIECRIGGNHRFHADFFEAKVPEMQHIFCKVEIQARKRSSDIIVFPIAALRHL